MISPNRMRVAFAAALLLLSVVALRDARAEEAKKPLAIAIEPLGDNQHGVVTRVFFRFANPRAITAAGLFLEGSLTQDGRVPVNFRLAVPRKGDKLIWNNTVRRNCRTIRNTRYAVLPDQRNEVELVQTLGEGTARIDARLVLEGDNGDPQRLISEAAETFTLQKTSRPYVLDDVEVDVELEIEAEPDDGELPPVIEDATPLETGAVSIRAPRHNEESNLYFVAVDVLPPVKRVEFRVGDKKVLARNAPPYTAELDLGASAERIALRAIGYDAAGHYVDADAFVVNDRTTRLAVEITHTATSDGLTHFKLTIRGTPKTNVTSVVLYAGETKLQEWDGPPYTLSVPTATLANVDSVRAVVADEDGSEVSDVQALRRD